MKIVRELGLKKAMDYYMSEESYIWLRRAEKMWPLFFLKMTIRGMLNSFKIPHKKKVVKIQESTNHLIIHFDESPNDFDLLFEKPPGAYVPSVNKIHDFKRKRFIKSLFKSRRKM